MENEDQPLSHTQSLGIIEQMIAAAKNEHREKGDGWLLWGWLLFIASVLSAVFMQTALTQYIGWTWTGVLVVGFSLMLYFYFTRKKKEEVTTYVQGLLNKFSTGFFISLLVLVAASNLSGSSFSFGYYYVLYAFWMFIHGSAIRFQPLIIGAIVNWAAAIAIFVTPDFFYKMVISAIAILVGYLIPGYMLRNQFKKLSQANKESI
jgi:Flp pilus assembly protein TadB